MSNNFELRDVSGVHYMPVQVVQSDPGIIIEMEDYPAPLLLELDSEGEPVLYVYADHCQDEPTHKISLKNANAEIACS